ncbi:hypothetical protein E4U42_001150 [Claviceps africana]|uniref:LPXTG-motif cell wall anchor domain protein n=1 Tax=Claviceps africana TaxID=83212 RepID=A0A8K0IZC0_9HYPO|nr:hypothetical protein E4U42_001150 [Claviceps africana]
MNFISRPYDMDVVFAHSPEKQSQSALDRRYAQAASSSSFHQSDSDRQDDTGDVFLRIAREEAAVPRLRDHGLDDTLTSLPGLRRTSHRRPLSTVTAAAAAYHDQQDGSWHPKYLEDDQASERTRTTTFPPATHREKAASVHPGDDISRTRSGGPSPHLRPSPSARSAVGHDSNGNEASIYARRRASITESNSTVGGRNSAYKASGLSHGRNYGSSPLGKAVDLQARPVSDTVHGLEGTESTASTTAPSTVWDELDDLKSRIHRLELTGKLPSTSGAAVSRHSEERPATATTTVTTMSLSPKRQGPGQQPTAAPSTVSSQRESYPILQAALAKSKPFLSSDVFQALEAAANDALSLSAMLGGLGQPGSVSEVASVVGVGVGAGVGVGGGAVSGRQLRRKADSVCRSLTELCVALGDDTVQQLVPAGTSPVLAQNDGPATPTVPRSYSGFLPPPRRTSVAEQLSPGSSSPRALSKFEERRSLILNSTALPPLRTTISTPNTPVDSSVPRRSSLMIARTRRAGTEELDPARAPSVLRSRRAGVEEGEESRQALTTTTGRSRRSTVGENAYEDNFRPLSRAGTDVNMLRGQGREYPLEPQSASLDTLAQNTSAPSRRRFLSTNFHSSRSGGSPGSNGAFPRRYLDRSPLPEQDTRDDAGDATTQRHGPPLSKGMAHTRASSFSTRRSRDNFMATNSSATTGAYR